MKSAEKKAGAKESWTEPVITSQEPLTSRPAGPIERFLDTGDRAVGVPALRELYDRMNVAPVSVDLDDLRRRLGVHGEGADLTLDDSAPLAAVRRAILVGKTQP